MSVCKYNMEQITIDIDGDILLKLALMAHEQDITLNELICNILKEHIQKEENES
jgi:predicted HicB family RNase H-like nuclease